MKDLQLDEIRDLLIKANDISNYELRVEMQKVIWNTLIFYLSGNYKKLKGEEKLAQDIILENFK